jgi:LysR family hydrogen peroxide-inducible transcriptional activator
MTLDQLHYANELRKAGNFSRAAAACGISQPSLSVRISALEKELGVALFVRARGGVKLTPEGDELMKEAQGVLDAVARLERHAHDLSEKVHGSFCLGIIPTLGPSLLPLFLKHFARAHPEAKIEIREESTAQLIAGIAAGQVDAAILSTPPRCPEGFMEKVLFYEPLLLFASRGHETLESRKRVFPSELSVERMILLEDPHCLRDQTLQLCRKRPASEESPRVALKSGSLQTVVEMIRREPGATLLPSLSLRFLTAAEKISGVRDFADPVPARKVSLIYHKSRPKRALLESLQACIDEAVPRDLPRRSAGLRVLAPEGHRFET